MSRKSNMTKGSKREHFQIWQGILGSRGLTLRASVSCFSKALVMAAVSALSTPSALAKKDYSSELSSREIPAETPRGWARELGGQTRLFTLYHEKIPTEGSKQIQWHSMWKEDLTGNKALIERIYFDPENMRIDRYEIQKLQLDEKGWFEPDYEKKKVSFTYYKNGEWKKARKGFSKDLVIGPLIPAYIALKEKELMAGEQLKVSLPVSFMRDIYTFRLKLEEHVQFEGQKVAKIKFSPSSMMMRAVVKPLYFYYSPSMKKVRKIEGKIPLKKRVGSDPDKWDSFEAESLFLEPESLK